MLHRIISTGRAFSRTLFRALSSPQGLLMLVSVVLAATHPALASSVAGVDSAGTQTRSSIDSFRTGYALPIITGICGLGAAIGVVGTIYQPEKRAIFAALAGVGVVGVAAVGGPVAVMAVMDHMAATTAGFAIH